MVSDGKRIHGETIEHADQIGKAFVVVGQDLRRCLICECVFTPQAPRSTPRQCAIHQGEILGLAEETMQIGEPLRTIVVETA